MKKYILSIMVCLLFIGLTNAQIDRSKRPVPGPAPTIHLATPQSFDLNNGMKVMVVRNTKLPRVRIQLLIDNPLYASEDKAGVETILAQMLGNGTTTISKNEFNEEIDFLGATINFGSQRGFASSLSKYFDRVFELFADAAINPLLVEEEFQSEKARLLESLRNNERDVSAISRRVSTALLYGRNHPKGEFTTIETVENITLQDVKDYYDNFFSPQNAYLIIIGDVDTPKVEALSNQYFANWTRKSVKSLTYSDPQDVQFTQINFIDMPNAVQSELVIVNVVNLKMSDPDYFPVLIANSILGGDFNSYLNMNLREDKGWTYGARSSTGAGKHVTGFTASTSVRNAVTDSAVVEMLKEIRNIREHLVENDKLALAKASFTGNFVMALERPETIANYALNIETQNLPKDFYENYLRRINAVTAADVKRVANKYYRVDNARIVVTGKGSEILEGLKNIDRGDGTMIPVRYFDIYGNEVEAPNYNVEIDPSVTAETVLNNYINAIGGKNKLQPVKSVFTTAGATMQGMQLGMEMKVTSDNKMSQAILMGGMALQKTVFNKNKGYSITQGQRADLDEKQIEGFKASAYPFPELKPGEISLKGIENVNGSNAYAVSFGKDRVSFYDMETGLKVKDENTVEMNGMELKTAVYYNDYQEVSGIKFPHTLTISAGPQEIKFEVSEIKINEGVSDADFE
jgi:zinc protease